MYFQVLYSAATLLAITAGAVPIAEAPGSAAIPAGDHIQRLDASSNCLSPSAEMLSGSSRVVLDSVARELQGSMFRDFHQFAPAALALGDSDIEGKILGDDYKSTIAGLRELQSLLKTSVPETTQIANGSNECDAPTAKNLRVISTNLDKLLVQFV
ncbi:hypothetical protein IW150_001030 [Coemansia sp. RSA 2607]|nr:hypothetical protein IW150_001030 [Coemansia sp. RSA 2607]KAJ2393434.1 hypothetical protein GGI05_002427 [Coemansia sp. RSA 2603]